MTIAVGAVLGLVIGFVIVSIASAISASIRHHRYRRELHEHKVNALANDLAALRSRIWNLENKFEQEQRYRQNVF